jgi:hypothetical protein
MIFPVRLKKYDGKQATTSLKRLAPATLLDHGGQRPEISRKKKSKTKHGLKVERFELRIVAGSRN